jgi:hypothetical protein
MHRIQHTPDPQPYTGLESQPKRLSERSRWIGLFHVATMVQLVCEYFGITQGTAAKAFDCLSALQQTTDPEHIVKPNLVTGKSAVLQLCKSQSTCCRRWSNTLLANTRLLVSDRNQANLLQSPSRDPRWKFTVLTVQHTGPNDEHSAESIPLQSTGIHTMGNESSIDHATPMDPQKHFWPQ